MFAQLKSAWAGRHSTTAVSTPGKTLWIVPLMSSCVSVSVSGVAIRLVCCAARASREAFIAAHHSSVNRGSSVTTALPTGAPGSSSVSSARHITGSVSSRHATPASQAGFAIPTRASADAVPSPP